MKSSTATVIAALVALAGVIISNERYNQGYENGKSEIRQQILSDDTSEPALQEKLEEQYQLGYSEGYDKALEEYPSTSNAQSTSTTSENLATMEAEPKSGYIWDILPEERINGPELYFPNGGNTFILSGQPKYGVYVKPTWGVHNIYIYLNKEFSFVRFSIGHVDKSIERDAEITFYLDGKISDKYPEPITISYAAQPQEFSFDNLSDVGTLQIVFDNHRDGSGGGPTYGITDIYLES